MKLTILGCHSATPRIDTHPTAQVLEVRGHIFLLDCGEGTQVRLRENKIKFSRIKHIFISHLHGDHYFGLPGLVSTFRLSGREADLHIYGPKGIKEVITLQMKLADSWTNYNLIFHELSSSAPETIFEDDKVTVKTIPLDHRVYTNGFLFKEQPYERKLDMDKVREMKIDMAYFSKLKQGKDVPNEKGELIRNNLVTVSGPKRRSYAYCTDTAYNERIVNQIKGVDTLYHESTFLEDHAELAAPTKHATALQAARIAKKADVHQLILGHYSTRYKDINAFREEAETVFDRVLLAESGKTFEI